jgi:hypothetical protein
MDNGPASVDELDRWPSYWFRECLLSEAIGLARVMNFAPQSNIECNFARGLKSVRRT